MKFKLVEKFDETRSIVQDYMYDAMDELNNASLEEYIQWFKNLNYYDEYVEQAVTDAYIEACDYGMIKGVEKTRLTSELKEYIESNVDLIDKDIAELINNCPDHLQHELKIVLSKLDESLNESNRNVRPFYHYSNTNYAIGEKIIKHHSLKPEISGSYNLAIPEHDCRTYVYMLDGLKAEYEESYEYVYEVLPSNPKRVKMDFSPLVLHSDLSTFLKQTNLSELTLIKLFTEAYTDSIDNEKLKILCYLLRYPDSCIDKYEYVSSDVIVKDRKVLN